MATTLGVFERVTVSVEEAGRLLGISRGSAYEAVRRGDIPHLRIGKRLIVPVAALQNLLASAGKAQPEQADDDGD